MKIAEGERDTQYQNSAETVVCSNLISLDSSRLRTGLGEDLLVDAKMRLDRSRKVNWAYCENTHGDMKSVCPRLDACWPLSVGGLIDMAEVEDDLDLAGRKAFVQVASADWLVCAFSCPCRSVMAVEACSYPRYRYMVFQLQFSMREEYLSLPFGDVRLPGKQIAQMHDLALGAFL